MRRSAAIAMLAVAGPAAAECVADKIVFERDDSAVAFDVEVADEPAERARGLMFRESLARDAGMLFLFDPPRPVAFWMKNTPLSLDMIFLDAVGRVCGVAERTTPFSLDAVPSPCAARAVLEVNGGVAAARGLGPGAQARHPAFAGACDGVAGPADDG